MPRVLIGGTFDPLHAGHVAYIRAAARLGKVCCAVSDNPAKHQPLVPIADRVEMLLQLGCADVFEEGPGLAALLARQQPDIYLTGSDWRGRLPADEVAACKASGIAIRHCDTRLNSSSALLAAYERARNAGKLAALEAFVSQQQPACKPWEPVTDYSRDERRRIEGPNANVIRTWFEGCSVLDVGCGNGYLVEILRERGMTVEGCDLRYDCDRWVDISDPTVAEWDRDRDYDLVICREVLEHLTVRQLAVAVRNIVKLSSRYVYVTTRFTGRSHLLDFDRADDLDPTHITLLQQDMLRTLFVLEGCTRRADLETALDWRKLGRVLVYEVPA